MATLFRRYVLIPLYYYCIQLFILKQMTLSILLNEYASGAREMYFSLRKFQLQYCCTSANYALLFLTGTKCNTFYENSQLNYTSAKYTLLFLTSAHQALTKCISFCEKSSLSCKQANELCILVRIKRYPNIFLSTKIPTSVVHQNQTPRTKCAVFVFFSVVIRSHVRFIRSDARRFS